MALHKLLVDDFYDDSYVLIAVHCGLEDYRLAYYINQKLPVLLSKSADEIQISIKQGETNFSRYNYFNSEDAIAWNLVQNKNEVYQSEKEDTNDLFSSIAMNLATKVYLLPEFKKADYFLKIDNAQNAVNLSEIKTILNTIDSVSTVYTIDTNQIKSKNNLIF